MDNSKKIELTPEGRQKLLEELAWREGDHDAEIIERIKVARDFGDLSENSEYDDAKEEQSKNASRIAEIRKILSTAKVSENAGHVLAVSIGSTGEEAARKIPNARVRVFNQLNECSGKPSP